MILGGGGDKEYLKLSLSAIELFAFLAFLYSTAAVSLEIQKAH